MPVYEYKCSKCHKVFEEHRSIKDKPMTECKECGGPLKRLYSPAGIVFKGTGFHVTDYGKGRGGDSSSKSSAK